MSGLKLRRIPFFPREAIGGAGIDVVKANGNWTISLDYGKFGLNSPYVPQLGHRVVIFAEGTDSYFTVPTTVLAGSPPSFVTFDPFTAAGCTLSNGNLTATRTSGSNAGVFVFLSEGKTSGKYYFEITATTIGGFINGGGWGVATTTATQFDVNNGNADTAMLMQWNPGFIFGGGSQVYSLATINQGDVIGIAVDLDNRKIWFKDITQGGPWNGSVANGNPATNLNGVVVPAGTIIPVVGFGANVDVFTANFGALTFAGPVPSGFTSGWTA